MDTNIILFIASPIMTKQAKRNYIYWIFAGFIATLVLIVVLSKAHSQKELSIPPSPSPIADNSPEGVTNNFYQWFASCTEEMEENGEEDLDDVCYQKTTYLKPELVSEINSNNESITCNKTFDFHSIKVALKTRSQNIAETQVNNSKNGEQISLVKTEQINNNWVITDITCN
jgi:hypothetical protein